WEMGSVVVGSMFSPNGNIAHYCTVMNQTIVDIHYVLYQSQNGTRLFLLLSFFFKGIKQAFPI
ncbi:hypothetical protein, partial [Bacteroides cellulosilyticus]|uniref:hypothetical protein n=1 Tax=Bacteroides cellulosilyticus TaxID=246787 RepID=UPI0032C05DB7